MASPTSHNSVVGKSIKSVNVELKSPLTTVPL